MKANYANGVKRLILEIPEGIPNEHLTDLQVCLSESKWIMTKTIAFIMILFPVCHLILTIYFMRSRGMIECCDSCCDVDDDYKDGNFLERTVEGDEKV